jgi:hypothetical protein
LTVPFVAPMQMILDMAWERTGLQAYADYGKRKRLPDNLYEEYLPILAVLNDKKVPGGEEIELGDETQEWDARVGNTDIFEVVQALPADEHEIRLQLASGARPVTYIKHRRTSAFHFAGRRSPTPSGIRPATPCHAYVLSNVSRAESRAFGLARPDAGRMRCPAETLGEGEGERTAGSGRVTAPVEGS